MDKKDIYEHLAKIYLDASSKRKKKSRKRPIFLKQVALVSVLVISGSVILSVAYLKGRAKFKPLNSEIALLLTHEAAKINFNFNPAKKETYSLDLRSLDLRKFKALSFSLKKLNYKDTISLRVEFINNFKEKSEVYLKNIAHKWRDYRVSLEDFKNISDWSGISQVNFVVEEWNTREDSGVVYIDNLRLIR